MLTVNAGTGYGSSLKCQFCHDTDVPYTRHVVAVHMSFLVDLFLTARGRVVIGVHVPGAGRSRTVATVPPSTVR